MTDTLTTGAERLAKGIGQHLDRVVEIDADFSSNEQFRQAIAADPGVKALVEYVQRQIDCGGALVMEDARAALKLWEHGS